MQKLSLDESVTSVSAAQEPQVGFGPTSGRLDSETDSNRSAMRRASFNSEGSSAMSSKPPVAMVAVMLLLAVGAGIATGYGGYKLKAKDGVSTDSGATPMQQVAGDSVKAGQVFGVQDEKTFKDSAEGYLEEGGVNGEGSHHLLRAGGVSQTVVLTSSVTDLSKFVGMQVKVGGETFKAQKAGWLMDVGRVQVINPKGQAPTEE